VLLSHREQGWTQADLEARTGISRALVSLTLADLIEQEQVVQTRAGNRHLAALYRVDDFGRLLEAWSAADDWRERVTIQQYSLLAGNLVEVAETAREALGGKNVFFTQWFAAHLRHPHTTPPLVSAYLRKKPPGEITWGRKVDNGGNLWLITPKDEGVFQETQSVEGFNLVSDIQIYLDLLQVGQRGPEQAQALREWEGFAK
jgi:transcriptional regulator with XRE-family HTH domain